MFKDLPFHWIFTALADARPEQAGAGEDRLTLHLARSEHDTVALAAGQEKNAP
jgi:hypothetical protein